MRAVVLPAPHRPMELRDIPAREPGPGQVRIRMRASGLCGTDLHVYEGVFPIPMPAVLGHEPVGVIESVGPGVTHLKVGQRVGVSWTQGGCGHCGACAVHQPIYCGDEISWIQNGGGNSELMIAEASGTVPLPDGLRWEDAAPLFCAGYTIMSGYRNARPRPGDRVAVIGVGGLGHLAIQVAKAMGHEVLAVTSSESKRGEARDLGADEVLVVREHAGKELRAAGGADVVLSTSNSMEQNSQVLAGLRPEGRYVGMALGGPMTVDPLTLIWGQITIHGSKQNDRKDLVEILELTARGKVKPKLELYPLKDANVALTRLAEGKVRYRAVLLHDA